jgi:arsenate reductase
MQRKILFLCTGNSARSQMAEALLRKYAGEDFQVFSAGAEPSNRVFPPVVAVMNEIGIDISHARPKGLDTYLGHMHFSKVIIVCSEADKKCPQIFGSAQRLYWPFDDPAAAQGTEAEILEACRSIRDRIDARIRQWLKEEGLGTV